MINIEGLNKRYGDFVAVNDVSFRAEAGEIFGLLGPNGAGKSTTIGCLSGLLEPSGGHVSVLNHDVVREGLASRRQLGLVPQELAIYEDLTAMENLNYWGAVYGLRSVALRDRVWSVLERIGLQDRAKEPVKNFSGGMKRRLNFGCGIVHDPKVLLLDEPTVGVDPQSRKKLLDLIREQAGNGTCVLYTTHHMEEAEQLCKRLAVIDHGKIIAQGTVDELRRQMGERDVVRIQGEFDVKVVRDAFNRDGIEVLLLDEVQLHLAVSDAPQQLSGLFETLNQTGARVSETSLTRPNLESLFIKLTGKELRE